MRKIKEVLRLKWAQGLSNRQIAKACGIARPTVAEYLRRVAEAGLAWPLPANLDEATLEQQLFPPPPSLPAQARGVPDWSRVHQALKRKGVTLCYRRRKGAVNCRGDGRHLGVMASAGFGCCRGNRGNRCLLEIQVVV